MRTKITLLFSITIAIVSIVLLLLFRYICGIILYNNAKSTLFDSVNRSADNINYDDEKSLLSENNNAIEYENGYLVIDEGLFNANSLIHTSLYDEDNTLLAGTSPISKELRRYQPTNNNFFSINSLEGSYQVYERSIKISNDSFLYIRGVMSIEGIIKQLSDITEITSYVIVLIIMLSSIFAYVFANRLIMPITRINSITSRINNEYDLNKRMNILKNNNEVNQLAHSLDEMMERLEEAFANKNKLVTDISQEVRKPLSVIIAECEYMLDRKREQTEYQEALRTILRQSGVIYRLMNRVIEYINLDKKQNKFPISNINLSSIVNEIGKEMKLLKEKNIGLYIEVEDNIHIYGNRVLQACLIENIISNAYRYGRENGHIKVRLFSEDNKALLEVEDDGCGICDEPLDNIFTAFEHSNHHKYGYGLGLSMVKKIVEIHNGSIDIKGDSGQGSCFRFVFDQV